MTVDTKRLPTLKVGSEGKAVVAAKKGINHWGGKQGNVTPTFGEFFVPLVKAFQKAKGTPQSGVIGPATWADLLAYIPPKDRLLLPQKPVVPNLGPVMPGGKSVLAHDLTHATDGIPLYPAFDDAFFQGARIIAPEDLTVTSPSHSRPGQAFYADGLSSIKWWLAHLDRTHPMGRRFAKGELVGLVAPNHIGGGPHCHVGINVERLWGRGRQLAHHTNYSHGAPTVGAQLTDTL